MTHVRRGGKWLLRLRRWGRIKRYDDGRVVGFIAGGFVASVDAVLPPKYHSGYPVIEGATFPITFHVDGPGVYKHGQAGGVRLRIPPVSAWQTRSVFLGLLYRGMWNSSYSRLTADGRAARRRARERRKHPERILGYERRLDGVRASDYERTPPP